MNRVGHPRNHVNHVMFVYIETAGRAGRNPCVFVRVTLERQEGQALQVGSQWFPACGGLQEVGSTGDAPPMF